MAPAAPSVVRSARPAVCARSRPAGRHGCPSVDRRPPDTGPRPRGGGTSLARSPSRPASWRAWSR